MTPQEAAIWIAIALIGLIGSALCSGIETGTYSINRVRLRLRAENPKDRRARRLQTELEQPERVLATLLLCNNAFNYTFTVSLAALLQRALGMGDVTILAVNALLVAPLLFVFGETLPKEFFRAEADRAVYRIVPFLRWARRILTVFPLVPLMMLFIRWISPFFNTDAAVALRSERARVASLVKEGARFGVLSSAQSSLIDRALAWRTVKVADEARPWQEVVSLRTGTPREQIVRTLRERPRTYYPVIAGDGSVLGVAHHLDLSLNPTPAGLASATRAALFIDPNSRAADGLSKLADNNAQLAIVGTKNKPLGIVTQKDLVEPITGDLAAW